jgi:hypothetical protein
MQAELSTTVIFRLLLDGFGSLKLLLVILLSKNKMKRDKIYNLR